MAFVLGEEQLFLFIQPLFLLVFSILIWSFQSFFITGISRKFIFPSLYRNPVTTYAVAQVSIFLHEASHFLSAIFTGSSIIGEETFVTPTHGKVTAASEESVVGWFSRMVAALAPSFLPPLLFLTIFFIISGQMPELITSFQYSKTFYDFQTLLTAKFNEVLVPDLLIFVKSITDLTNPLTFFFIYALVVCSVAAGPSEGDWRSTLKLFLSPIPMLSLLILFIFFSYAFSQFNISFVIPLILLITFVFIVVIVGVFYSFLISQLLSIAYKRSVHAIILLVFFFSIYYLAYYLNSDPTSSFTISLVPTIVLSLFIKARKGARNNKKTGRIL